MMALQFSSKNTNLKRKNREPECDSVIIMNSISIEIYLIGVRLKLVRDHVFRDIDPPLSSSLLWKKTKIETKQIHNLSY